MYIANIDDVTGLTLDSTGAKITAITMATSAKFHKFYFKPGQANITSTPQFNAAGEYAGEQAVISVSFGRQETTKRVQVSALSKGEMAMIAEDYNGKFWYYGKDNAVMATGGESTLGQARADFNHYGREFTANDLDLAYEVDADAVDDVVA